MTFKKDGDVNRIPRTLNNGFPKNPETVMKYSVGEPARVTLKIYNLLGQEIRALIDEIKNPGSYQIRWNGKDNLGRNVASGIYVYRRIGERLEQKHFAT